MQSELQRARTLELPGREAMLRRDPSVQRFWDENSSLLARAWSEWEQDDERDDGLLSAGALIDPTLRAAVQSAWNDPDEEGSVRDLLDEVAPGVFHFQFFDPERLTALRDFLEDVWDAQIPLRPPYGIVLNRRGAMLDERSTGYLAAPTFQALYREVLSTYMRPIARMVFPEIVGYDTQTFGFSINYKPTTDTSIRPHSDASSVTLNINLNMPGEEFTGSEVDFLDPATNEVHSLTFVAGSAMLHRGSALHMAQPITSGERTNLVLWLFGDRGCTPLQQNQSVVVDARTRWTHSDTAQDDYAPF